MTQASQNADSSKFPRRSQHSISRRKRPSDDELSPDTWAEETDSNGKCMHYDHSKRDADPPSDEGVIMEPTGRRVERKDRKNKREQERRKEINDRFALLSDLLFGSKFSGRVDKTQILDRAIDLVRNGPSILRNNDNLGPPEPREESVPPREVWQQGEFSNANGDKQMQSAHGGRYHESCRGAHCSHELPMDSRDVGHGKYPHASYQSYPNFPQQNGSMGFNSNYFFPNQYPHNASYPSAMLSEQSRFPPNGRMSRCVDCDNDASPERQAMHHHHTQGNGNSLPSHQQRRNGVATTTNNNNNGWVGSSRKDFQRNDASSDAAAELAELAEVSQGVEGRRFASGALLLTADSGNSKDYDPIAKVQVALLDTLVQLSQNPKRLKR